MFLGMYPMIILMVLVGFAADLTAAVIGFIIVSGKTKSVKILGLSFGVNGIIGIIQQAGLVARYLNPTPETVGKISSASSVVAGVSTLFGILCICLFIHKNYGCKWIYFPLFAQPVVNVVSRMAFLAVLSRIGGEMMLIAGTGLSSGITSLVTGTVTSIILIVVFYKNRKNEKVIPHMWIIRLITYCWGLILTIAGIGFYAYCLSRGANAERLYVELSSKFSEFQTIYMILDSFVYVVMPIYILVMAKKAERNLEETAAYIEE